VFDSGSIPSPSAVTRHGTEAFEETFPDFISEGLDQTRGWFYSLLAISTCSSREAYRMSSAGWWSTRRARKARKSRGTCWTRISCSTNFGSDAGALVLLRLTL